MNSPRKGAGRPSVLLDMRPLQGKSASRGVGAYARGLLGGLVRTGFDANLTLLLDVDLDEPPLPAGRYALAGCRRRSHGRLAAFEDAVALNADIARIGPDLYHAIDFRLPGRCPRPLVVTLHDLIPWAWGGGAMRGERMRYRLAPRLLRRADAVIAVSKATAADAVRLGVAPERRISVIHEAAGASFARREGAAARVAGRWGVEAGYLLFVGALDVRKDPASLIQAWNVARRSRPDLRLVIAGDPGRQAPQGMEGALQVGRVDDGELADLYTAAGCLVFPSRYEGFGLPCLEAMACGCPVVTFRNSSLPEVVGDAGVLVDDGDAAALGTAAAGVLSRRERWSGAGLARAGMFSWDRAARETVDCYRRALRGR